MITADVKQRAKELIQELTANPFFPLLFISESTKLSAFWLVDKASTEATVVSYVMTIVSVVAWLYTYEEVQWGISKAQETIEEITDEQ